MRSNFGKECVSLDTSCTVYSLPRRDRLNQFQLPLYTLTRFRGRISKVCKATDLDFHGNLDALRLPSTHAYRLFPSPTLLTQFSFLLRPPTKLPSSISYSFLYYPRIDFIFSREDTKYYSLEKPFVKRELPVDDRSPSKGMYKLAKASLRLPFSEP